jgi:uroporphyrinogen decarboxylase
MTPNKALLDVLRGRKPKRRPVWLMRQAGRYLPEYREVRAKAGSFLSLCYSPTLAAEVTLQPLRRFDLDAAIVFSDILVVPHAMGLQLDFVENEGPRLETVSNSFDIGKLHEAVEQTYYGKVCETLSMVRGELPDHVALIGFCGAPWTIASYMIEGKSSERKQALAVASEAPAWFVGLIQRVIEHSVYFLSAQIKAGADVVQIFDSWAGDLPEAVRDKWVAEPISAIVQRLRVYHPDVPIIVFARGLGDGHARMANATGGNAIGIEQGTDLKRVLETLRPDCAIQGNLSPDVLAGGGVELDREVEEILAAVPRERHIFNLGHGILPHTNVAHVEQMLNEIRTREELSA